MIKDGNGKEYQVVVTTPAGREEYLSIFKKFIYRKMDEGLIDGWQLWQNTVKESDIAYLASMEAENPKVKVYKLDEAITPTWRNTNALQTFEFFKNCHDDNTIYVRFDDDIVWVEEGAIEKMLNARIACPNAFAIYPNIINSTVCSSWHQDIHALGTEAGICHKQSENPEDPNWVYLDEFAYADSKFIDLIHDTFKKRYTENSLSAYYLPNRSFDDFQRFSICSLVWWGKDKLVPETLEEQWLSWQRPAELNRPNFFVGNALMVHYSYHTQIEYLESQGQKHLPFFNEITK